MNPINENEDMTPSNLSKKDTKSNSINNFLVDDRFKRFGVEKPKRNQMKHLTPKKKKRK